MFLGKCLRENQRGNRWTQGGEGEGGGTSGETAGRREGKEEREGGRKEES